MGENGKGWNLNVASFDGHWLDGALEVRDQNGKCSDLQSTVSLQLEAPIHNWLTKLEFKTTSRVWTSTATLFVITSLGDPTIRLIS
jgi:hypothetical protein